MPRTNSCGSCRPASPARTWTPPPPTSTPPRLRPQSFSLTAPLLLLYLIEKLNLNSHLLASLLLLFQHRPLSITQLQTPQTPLLLPPLSLMICMWVKIKRVPLSVAIQTMTQSPEQGRISNSPCPYHLLDYSGRQRRPLTLSLHYNAVED